MPLLPGRGSPGYDRSQEMAALSPRGTTLADRTRIHHAPPQRNDETGRYPFGARATRALDAAESDAKPLTVGLSEYGCEWEGRLRTLLFA